MNDIEDYCPHALMELFCKALDDKRKPYRTTSEIMKEHSQEKKERGLNGMRASWG